MSHVGRKTIAQHAILQRLEQKMVCAGAAQGFGASLAYAERKRAFTQRRFLRFNVEFTYCKNLAVVKQQKNITPEQALARLQRSCALRETCSQAAQRKLTQWKIAPPHAERIMQKLLSEKWIDDRRYAEAFAREKSRIAKWGSIKIRAYLQAKRIATADINHALSFIETDDESAAIEELLNKKVKTLKAKSSEDLLAKLLRFGTSRGYKYEQVIKAARRITKSEE
jgi:regulatory protein